MPSYTINTDALTALQSYTGASTVQTVLENIVFTVASDYRRQFESVDINDALGDYLASVQEGRSVGMVKQIRVYAAELLAAGVTVAGGKSVAANAANVDTLTVAAALTAAQIGALSLPAVDGTRWQINTPARATTALASINSRISAVNGVRDSAIASFQALTTAQQKRDFQFSSITWPT